MANYIDNQASDAQSICEWLTKYNALCAELNTDIDNLGTLHNNQQTSINTLSATLTSVIADNTAQQEQIDDLIVAVGDGDFVPLAGADVEEGFYLAVEDARMQLSGNGVELIIPAVGYVALSPDGFTTDDITKAGYLNDATLRAYNDMDDKEWVAKGQLQTTLVGIDVGAATVLPHHKHFTYSVQNFDDIGITGSILDFYLDFGTYKTGDRFTICVPNLGGRTITITTDINQIVTDIVGATITNPITNPAAYVFTDSTQPVGAYCSKYEVTYDEVFGFLVDVKHYRNS